MGGVDTQELLVHATTQEIKTEVRRLKDILGPCYIVSPSHEAILPNVPVENVIAMAQASHE
jgi:uroporphyrinogen decarboxylase